MRQRKKNDVGLMILVFFIAIAFVVGASLVSSDRKATSDRGTLAELLALPWAQARGVQQEEVAGGASTLMLKAMGPHEYQRYSPSTITKAFEIKNITLAIWTSKGVRLPVVRREASAKEKANE